MSKIHKEKAEAFIEEIIEVSKKHNFSLSHEDIGGNFYVYPYDERKTDWLKKFRIGLDSDRGVYRSVSEELN